MKQMPEDVMRKLYQTIRGLLHKSLHGYRPEKHYMRGRSKNIG